jgi:hypothetical protein
MGWGKSHLLVDRPLAAGRCNTNGSVPGRSTRIAAHASDHIVESLLQVIMLNRAVPAYAIAAHAYMARELPHIKQCNSFAGLPKGPYQSNQSATLF